MAILRAKSSAEEKAGNTMAGKIRVGAGEGEEEVVEKEGADAVSAMLSTFDDSDDDES